SRESGSMTAYSDEPKSAAELLARYRDVKRRLYPVPPRSMNRESASVDTENMLAFVLAAAAFTAERARESRKRADKVPGRIGAETPGSKARAALRAVSQRTGVPVDAILGRRRLSAIVAARHEAVWRVREVTKWSLPRVGQFLRWPRPYDRPALCASHGRSCGSGSRAPRLYGQRQAGPPQATFCRR